MMQDSTTGLRGTPTTAMNVALWVVQGLMALLFVFSGVTKFVMPAAKMQAGPIKFSMLFLHFIGLCEILGGLGLVLPAMLKIQRRLTPLAAAGLVIIMIGATVVTVMSGGGPTVLIPVVCGLLVAFVAWGRWGWLRS